jgi:pimeloyl-ACP methyl ester carboxylesterase
VTFTVRTPGLEIACETHGDPRGFPIILLHGFPDDARAWDGVSCQAYRAGYIGQRQHLGSARDSLGPAFSEIVKLT